nr:restriction endonuclease subunit S [Acinetobacter colistiniresistens]
MATPKLRFKEFASKVEVKKLGNISNIVVGFVGTVSDQYCDQNEGVPFVRTQNVREGYFSIENLEYVTKEFHKKNKKSQIFNGDVLIARVGANMGMVCAVENLNTEANCANVIIIKKNSQLNSQYLSLFLNSENGQKQIHSGGAGGAQAVFNTTLAKEISFPYFPLQEQTKIASFLSAVDEKISQLTQKHALLSQYKQGMMQKLFSQQIRFKADDGSEFGEWEEKPLNEIASKRSGKNKDGSISEVLTNSATQGIIKQSDYFEREIVTESNLNGYYIVNLDDFVYNPRISVHAPVGPIKRNKKCLGVMSPLYTVFTVVEGNLAYLEYFFDSNFWHDYVKGVANSGARHDRMNITNKDFFDMPILYPCLEEQTKIANFLSAIDQKIEVVSQQIEQAKQWKKGLLQQMFV